MATKLWATAYLLVNGTLADIQLFGSFLGPVNDIVAVAVGLAIYFAFGRWLHSWLIGVPIIAT
jgi:uncharacterized membrane protein